MKAIYFISIITILIGCKKFEHQDLSNSGCNYCQYAKTLEGEYRGKIGSVYTQMKDSVTVFIEQVFLGQSSIQDSLIINLKMTYSPDNSASYSDTIRLIDNTGKTMDYIYLNGTKLRNDVISITQDKIVFNGFFYANKDHVPYRVGTLYKQ